MFNFLNLRIMYTIFAGLKHSEKGNDSAKLAETVARDLIAAGICPDALVPGVAVYERAKPSAPGFETVTEHGVVMMFKDEEEAKRTAFYMKPRLRLGTFTVKLNDYARETKSFSTHFAYNQDGHDTVEKGASAWKALSEKAKEKNGVFVAACLFEAPIGVRAVGSANSEQTDMRLWEETVMQVIKDADDLGYPKFTEN